MQIRRILSRSGTPSTAVLLTSFLSSRHHIYQQNGDEEELTELGPRFEMRAYEVKLGTVDMGDADSEWSLRPYMNTSRKRDVL